MVLGGDARQSEVVLEIAAADGVPASAVGWHAGEGETSEMLALRPDLVDMRQATPGYCGDDSDLMTVLRRDGLAAVTPTGILGDGSPAEAGRGRRYLAAQVEACREALMPTEAQSQ